MKNLLIRFAIIVFPFLLLSSTSCPNYCLSGSISVNANVYTLAHNGGNSGCTSNSWRASTHPSENYLVRWVLVNGGNKFVTSSSSATAPNLSVNSAQAVAFTNATNTYGDDDDADVIIGGGNNGNLPTSGLSVNNFPSGQNDVVGSQLIKINTAHTTNKAEKCNQLLLVLTINNEIIDRDIPAITESNLRLHLFHNTQSNKITFISPGQASKYFAFASVNSTNIFSYNNLTKAASWDILNNFNGGEKNIYCLLDLTDNFIATDLEKVTFTAVLTNTSDVLINSNTAVDNFDVYVGSSYDPNTISVDKATTTTCGESGPEEYIYTVQFQNVGKAAASSVFINLETDRAIDPETITVMEAVIGNGTNLYLNNTQLFRDCNFPQNSAEKFYYSKNNIKTATPKHLGTVKPNISFSFQNIKLEGLNNSDISTSIGHVTFSSKTKLPFTTINNRAGIFFDNNAEIITNLAVTKCINDNATNPNGTDLTSDNCPKSLNCLLCWLGWLVALLLLIILIITRRKKNRETITK